MESIYKEKKGQEKERKKEGKGKGKCKLRKPVSNLSLKIFYILNMLRELFTIFVYNFIFAFNFRLAFFRMLADF